MKKGKALKRHLDRKHNERRVQIIKNIIYEWPSIWVRERWLKNAKSLLDHWQYSRAKKMNRRLDKAKDRNEVRKMLRNFEEWED